MSYLYLFKGVRFENDYTHVMDFATESEQKSWFFAKPNIYITNTNYVRKGNNIRIEKNIDEIVGYNYLMYANDSKEYYCFIKSKSYVSSTVTELEVEVDVFQTFLFNHALEESFVEREHIATDTIGANTEDEGLDVGEIVIKDFENVSGLEDISYIVASTCDSLGNDVSGQVVTGNYTGVAYYKGDADFVNNFITSLNNPDIGKADAIVSIFTMPSSMVSTSSGYRVNQPTSETINYIFTPNTGSLDGFTPRNKKLLCYPYNFLQVSNNMGGVATYKYEYFDNTGDQSFILHCDVSPNPTVFMTPMYYKGIHYNYDESLGLSGYPVCSWTTDLYKTWLAQNQVSNAISIGGGIISLASGVATGSPLAVGSGLLEIGSSIGQFKEKSMLPNTLKGGISGSGNLARGTLNFSIYRKTVSSNKAKVIDDFFHMFGYKTNRVKVPNRTSRPYFNYVKTINANVVGDIDNDYLIKLKQIYDGGVTIWHSTNFRNYAVNNY